MNSLDSDARRRNFGISDVRSAARMRHGYLLALEEIASAVIKQQNAGEQ